MEGRWLSLSLSINTLGLQIADSLILSFFLHLLAGKKDKEKLAQN